MTKEPFVSHSDLTNEIYIVCGTEKYLVTEQVVKAMQNTGRLEQQPSDEKIKYLECNDIDVQEFTKAMKKQPLQAVQPNSMQLVFEMMNRPTSDDCVSRQIIHSFKNKINDYGKDYTFSQEEILNILERYEIKASLPPVTPTIPKGATNGDMIKAMFPNVEIYTDVINEIVDIEICEDRSELRCSVDWWDAPYKGVE